MFMISLVIFGCGSIQKARQALVPEDDQRLSEAELRVWREGLEDFRSGNYTKAMAVFEFLSETAEDNELCRKAVYALACTRLILAQTPDELNEAMALWDCWSRQAPPEAKAEDPRMIEPFLDRLVLPQVAEPSLHKISKPKKKPIFKIDLVNRDLLVYKNLLETKAREFERTKARLEQREREVRRLKQQIETLEAIHLKFQEKQKEVSSP